MNNWGRELVTKILATSAPATAVLVRLIVGAVFLSEGIQKFLFPAALGVGRFAKIGIPWPGFTAPRRSRNSSRVSHARRRTTSCSIIAM